MNNGSKVHRANRGHPSIKWELQSEFSAQIAKLQHDAVAGQENLSQEVVKKLNRQVHQFQKKGNEAQFNFNASIEDHIDAAKKELGKSNPTGDQENTIIKKVIAHLDEGMKAIEVRQKHVRIADQSEFGVGCCSSLRE